jgi:hypothetical protein
MHGRLSALPDQATPLQRAQLVVALSVGIEIFQLHRIAARFGLGTELDAALAALAQGNTTVASEQLAQLDRRLAADADTQPESSLALRARASILEILEALTQHAAYFDSGAPT